MEGETSERTLSLLVAQETSQQTLDFHLLISLSRAMSVEAGHGTAVLLTGVIQC